MRVPYANRTADVELPAVAGQPRVTVKSIIDDFKTQMPDNCHRPRSLRAISTQDGPCHLSFRSEPRGILQPGPLLSRYTCCCSALSQSEMG